MTGTVDTRIEYRNNWVLFFVYMYIYTGRLGQTSRFVRFSSILEMEASFSDMGEMFCSIHSETLELSRKIITVRTQEIIIKVLPR